MLHYYCFNIEKIVDFSLKLEKHLKNLNIEKTFDFSFKFEKFEEHFKIIFANSSLELIKSNLGLGKFWFTFKIKITNLSNN